MAARTRHPLKSLLLFAAVCALGYFAYQNRHLLTRGPEEFLSVEQREDIREQVVTEFQSNPDFYTVRAFSWRPREQRYRIDIEVGDACEDARALCSEVAEFIGERADVAATVIAVDSTGRELGRAVL